MNIVYESSNVIEEKRTVDIDKTKKNIVIIGSGDNHSNRLEIHNPKNNIEALALYGEYSDLYKAFKSAYSITDNNNIYTINCYYSNDFIEAIDYVMQYDFNYIVPVGIYLRSSFINPITEEREYYADHYLTSLNNIDSLSTIIFTEKHAELYEDIDDFIYEMMDVVDEYKSGKDIKLDNYGNNLIFVLNTLKNIDFSNAILAAQLSKSNGSYYPEDLLYPNYETFFDIDYHDLNNNNICYYKHNLLKDNISIDNMFNLRETNDEYKVVMIDETIKTILRLLDFDEYIGRKYTPYINISIEDKLKVVLGNLIGKLIKRYKINTIKFVKTEKTSGYIYIEFSIMPFGSLEYIKIVRVV